MDFSMLWYCLQYSPFFCPMTSHCVRHFVQHCINLLFRKLSEERFFSSRDSNLNLIRSKVGRNHSRKSLDGCLKSLLGIPLSIVFLECALQLGRCFLFLRASGQGFVSHCVAWGIDFENLGTEFFVTTNERDHTAERANTCILREFLKPSAHTLSEHSDRDLVSELVLELSSSGSDLSNNYARVVHVANNDCTDAICDAENIAHTVWYD